MKKLIDKSIRKYLAEFQDVGFPLIYKNNQLRIYETFIGPDCDGSTVTAENLKDIALLADKIYYNEPLTKLELFNTIKFSDSLEKLRMNLIEFALNECPIDVRK